ncbi:hypothetical protein DOTSEDRAFT_138492 [Dothistroma septosporum NZE10]|uniref:Uncharacterized protein n=1 Tax=Dothistroma septosporum (strain NZE10 / CBS 128990) TaxID=675120 RepID=M2Y2Q5_DOTSN|nr:hypothetical protein DOTSEDRAFT_138492 [Dothistroma septosporum NZE10]
MTTSRRTVKTSLNFYDPINGPKNMYLNVSEVQSYKFITAPAEIIDIRSCDEELTLDKNGFQLANYEDELTGFENDTSIEEHVYPKVAEFLKKVTGASRVSTHVHMIRESTLSDLKSQAQRSDGPLEVLPPGPATNIHVASDQSYTGAHQFLKHNLPNEYEKVTKTRWAIINVWLPLAPVARDNLFVGDWRTMDPSQFHNIPLHFPTGDAKRNDDSYTHVDTWRIAPRTDGGKNDWYYASEMQPGEAILVKCFDTKLDRARCCPHGAFECEEDHGPARRSCEFRCFVFWEDQEAE